MVVVVVDDVVPVVARDPSFDKASDAAATFRGIRFRVPDHVYKAIDLLPITAHPMTQFITGVMALQALSIYRLLFEAKSGAKRENTHLAGELRNSFITNIGAAYGNIDYVEDRNNTPPFEEPTSSLVTAMSVTVGTPPWVHATAP
ncbi:citrate synthase, mitochondrial [Tanacetum coccineum]